jgi:hypothetical protein
MWVRLPPPAPSSLEALRIFMPSAAFAALTKSCQLKVGFAVWTIPSPCPGRPEFRRCPSSLYTFLARVSFQA